MQLSNGLVWSIPIILDVAPADWSALGTAVGDRVLLRHQDQPLAILDVAEVYSYDRSLMSRNVYGTTDPDHRAWRAPWP